MSSHSHTVSESTGHAVTHHLPTAHSSIKLQGAYYSKLDGIKYIPISSAEATGCDYLNLAVTLSPQSKATDNMRA